jgi:hypothetical protein
MSTVFREDIRECSGNHMPRSDCLSVIFVSYESYSGYKDVQAELIGRSSGLVIMRTYS